MRQSNIIDALTALTVDQLGRPFGDPAVRAGIIGPVMDAGETAELSPTQAKAIHDAAQTAWHEMKGALDESGLEVKRLGEVTAEQKQTIEKMEKALEDRLDLLETKGNRPRSGEDDANAMLQKQAFIAMIRKGDNRITPELSKALATDVDSDGGYLVPQNISQTIIEKLVQFSPIRSLANIESITQGNSLKIPMENGLFSAAWTSERAARPETGAGTFGRDEIRAQEMYANPLASDQMLDDAGYDIGAWIARKLGQQFGVLEATAFVNGDGVGKPEGLLNGEVPIGVTTAGAGVVTADDIFDLVFSLPEAYALNATLLWKRNTTRVLRKIKSTTGEYLWAPGLDSGTAPSFAGYAYREAIDMPDVATGAQAVMFADFQRLYTILDREGIVTLRDPYSNKPFVGFYTTKRVGGQVVLPEAGRVLVVQ